MAKKDLHDFIKRCRDDEALGKEIMNLYQSREKESALLSIAAREGFNVTPDDFKSIPGKALQEVNPQSLELNDEILTRVSGGFGGASRCKGCFFDTGDNFWALVCAICTELT